ncbi:MAG: diguanylate cyclase [Thermodesulfobacteriota bacterium]
MEQASDITSKKIWRPFILNISMVILLMILGIFIGLFINNKRLIENEIETRARSHFNNIVIMRRWNAMYGGVYVEKKAGVVSNPYLENPDITATNGKVYTKKNPALMTRELSEIANQGGDYQFHITSLKPLNPNNGPDPFERKALIAFEQGATELFGRESRDGKVLFRYMAPLRTEPACLQCHAKQGYQVGDVRGGVSVSFDIADIEKTLQFHRIILLVLFCAVITLLLGIIYFYIVKLMRKLEQAQERIKQMAITDELTGLYNRRYFFDRFEAEMARSIRNGHHLSCLLLDLDHFKTINDTHGHLAGDAVLRAIGRLLRKSSRGSDVVARYGGEEFVLLLPECGRECVAAAAEKLRRLVEQEEIPVGGANPLKVTVSCGGGYFPPEELQRMGMPGQVINLVDQALYRAKANGRNRVEMAETGGAELT